MATSLRTSELIPVQELSSETAGGAQVLRAEGLRKAFGGQVVLDGASLQLRRGEVALLRGDNGSGKTTLLNILTGNLEPDAGVLQLSANGRKELFTFPKPLWRRFTPFDHFAPETLAREGVSRSWQDTRLFGTQSLRANIAVATPRQFGESPFHAILRPLAVRQQDSRILQQADEALAELGLQDRAKSTAALVSLGQARRVAIARAVQAGARILYLDEPLAGLDSAGIATVVQMLQRLAREEQLTLVIVEHLLNIPRILDFATTVWTLKGGKLQVEDPEDVTTELAEHVGDGVRTWIRQVAGANGRISQERVPGGAVLTRVTPERAGDTAETVLDVRGLVVHRGKRQVIGSVGPDGATEGLSFSLRRGELAVLQAPNGWGKTTLMEALAGLVPTSRGQVRLLGQDVRRWPAWERRRRGLTLLRARDHTFPGLQVREALRLAGVGDAPGDLQRLMHRRASDLSGGERQKVATICALQQGAFQVALLDEPFLALDLSSLRATWSAFAGYLKQSALLLAVPGEAGDLA